MYTKMGKMNLEVKIPEDVQIDISNFKINAKGPKGEVSRDLPHQNISIKKEGSAITLEIKKSQYRALIGTWAAHIKNIIKGVKDPFLYKLKICSSHFPMNVKVQGTEIIVQNFIGEKSPKRSTLPAGVDVKVVGDVIEVRSTDIELAGRTCTLIEKLTKLTNKDRRVFMDSIVLIEKAGKKITM